MSAHPNGQRMSEAPIMVIERGQPPPGLIHHSNRRYATPAYRAILTARYRPPTMSKEGDCYDNVVAKSFFCGLKSQLLWE